VDPTIPRSCKCCTRNFTASNSYLEFCSPKCIETYFLIQQEELQGQKKVQLAALTALVNTCLNCGKEISAFTTRNAPKLYCGPVCVAKATSLKGHAPVVRPCVHCDVDVQVPSNLRPEFVRCAIHRNLWPKVRSDSAKNLKQTKVAEAPFERYLFRGPWWDHKRKSWTVLLVHSGASSKREMEYARYLLSVKTGHRVSDSDLVTYVDGDRTNVEISNLALG
jgi:hypothetical protein